MATRSSRVIGDILESFLEKVTEFGVIDIGLSNHQLIYCTRKICRIKRGSHKQIKIHSSKHCVVDLLEQDFSKLIFPIYENYNDVNEACNDFIQIRYLDTSL